MSSPRTLRETQTEATRAAILDAAERLFAEKGFAGTSMRALAREAATSQALLHHHFGTKDGLYEAVKGRFTDVYEAVQVVREDGAVFGVAFIHDTLLGYLRFLRAHPHYHRIRQWARLEGDHRPWGEEDAVWKRMEGAVRQGQEIGVVDPAADPALFLAAAASAITGWLDQRQLVCRALTLDADDPELDRRYIEQTVHLLLHGVATDALVALLQDA